jgi:hypothetical protein
MNEETILAALADIIPQVTWTRPGGNTVYRFKHISRRVRLWSDIPQDQWPACMQAEWSSDAQQTTNLPYKWTFSVNWIILQNTAKDPKVAGAIENNCIMNGIRAALAPKPSDPGYSNNRNSLGGLVHHCFITGKVFKDPGDIDAEGLMIVPIKLLVP